MLEAYFADLDALQKGAEFFSLPRRKDKELYLLLGKCLTLCNKVVQEGNENNLRNVIRARSSGHNARRRYIETRTDIYLIVCRYVFDKHTSGSRNKAWRYACVLREAKKHQIEAGALPRWLSVNNGMNTLFQARRPNPQEYQTSIIRLTSPITIRANTSITLTIQEFAYGSFNLLSLERPSP
jgi:hypothetical protein